MTIHDSQRWNLFIARQIDTDLANLKPAEKKAFKLRFAAENLTCYSAGCGEQKVFQTVVPSYEMSWQTYTKHRTEFFRKFSELGWEAPRRGKSESLLAWLENQFHESTQIIEPTEISLEEKLRFSLMTLNYRKQKAIFDDFKFASGPAAGLFLVQGRSGGCQKWLVNRLVYSYLPEVGSYYKISISLREHEAYVEDVWSQLGDQLLRNRDVTPSDLVEHVYQLWQEESIILAFYNLGELSESEPQKIINEFWNPLTARIQQDYKESEEGYDLLLFLVHNWGKTGKWALEATSDLSNWDYFQPIELPLIENFGINDIQPWVRENRNLDKLLPEPRKLRQVANELYQRGSEGDPERTMRAICKRCGANWYDIENLLAI